MAGTRYDQLLERALRENGEAMFKVDLGDSHKHALIKGQRLGLETALSLWQKVLKEVDTHDED